MDVEVHKLILKKGLKANLPTLAEGELGYTTDDKKLYIGDGTTNNLVNGSSGGASITEITYSELKSKRDASGLTSGQWYRITDYNCYLNSEITTIQSGLHQFDILVLAVETNQLNENAFAIKHEGDTYFQHSNLNAWKLKYSLDNDQEAYPWCASDGKGVIWWMCDEWGNECYYDFKNVKEARYEITADASGRFNNFSQCRYFTTSTSISNSTVDTSTQYYFYTFSTWFTFDGEIKDLSVYDFDNATFYQKISDNWDFGNNKLLDAGYIKGEKNKFNINCFILADKNYLTTSENLGFYQFCLYDNKLLGYSIGNTFNLANSFSQSFTKDSKTYSNGVVVKTYANEFGSVCCNNTLGSLFCYNKLDDFCYSNTFGSNCHDNTFGSSCYDNTFGSSCYDNTFGSSCYDNTFGSNCHDNTFGSSCCSNTFGNYYYSNTFGSSCCSNTFGNYYYSNTFGNYCKFNSFKNRCSYNFFGNYSSSNTFGNSCVNNSIGNACMRISFESDCNSNSIGNACSDINFKSSLCGYNIFGNNCKNIIFNGSYCYYNTFGNNCSNISFGSGCYSITFGSSCSYVYLGSSSSALTNYCQNIEFHNGVQYLYIYSTSTPSSSSNFQNIEVHTCNGTSGSYKTFSTSTLGQAYKINVFVNSSGTFTSNTVGY